MTCLSSSSPSFISVLLLLVTEESLRIRRVRYDATRAPAITFVTALVFCSLIPRLMQTTKRWLKPAWRSSPPSAPEDSRAYYEPALGLYATAIVNRKCGAPRRLSSRNGMGLIIESAEEPPSSDDV